jgi:DNA recombination protein RmuC
MVADIWKREYQNANALEIADRGGKLYDKFVGFVKDIESVETAVSKASESISSAKSKLISGRGNLVSQAESLRKLGLKPKKQLDEKLIDHSESKTE